MKAAGIVIAVPGLQAGAVAFYPGENPVAVIFELVKPILALRGLFDQRCKLRVGVVEGISRKLFVPFCSISAIVRPCGCWW